MDLELPESNNTKNKKRKRNINETALKNILLEVKSNIKSKKPSKKPAPFKPKTEPILNKQILKAKHKINKRSVRLSTKSTTSSSDTNDSTDDTGSISTDQSTLKPQNFKFIEDPSELVAKWCEENENYPQLSHEKCLETIKFLEVESKKVKAKLCHTCKIMKPDREYEYNNWENNHMIYKYIQKCILRQEWHFLKDLIRILMSQHVETNKYIVQELTFLLYLVHSRSNKRLLEEYVSKIFVDISRAQKMQQLHMWVKIDK